MQTLIIICLLLTNGSVVQSNFIVPGRVTDTTNTAPSCQAQAAAQLQRLIKAGWIKASDIAVYDHACYVKGVI